MRDDDARYYARRAEIETSLARQANVPEAVAIHQQLADLYRVHLQRVAHPRHLSNE